MLGGASAGVGAATASDVVGAASSMASFVLVTLMMTEMTRPTAAMVPRTIITVRVVVGFFGGCGCWYGYGYPGAPMLRDRSGGDRRALQNQAASSVSISPSNIGPVASGAMRNGSRRGCTRFHAAIRLTA